MASPKRISPAKVRETRDEGKEVLLVCAYKDEEKCEKFHVDGAFSLAEFQRRFSDAPKQKRIAFYCN